MYNTNIHNNELHIKYFLHYVNVLHFLILQYNLLPLYTHHN